MKTGWMALEAYLQMQTCNDIFYLLFREFLVRPTYCMSCIQMSLQVHIVTYFGL